MPRHQLYVPKQFANKLFQTLKSSIFCTLFFSQLFFGNDHCTAILQSTSLAPPPKLGAHMVRQPESTIAPLSDEVLFECGLNLLPDRLEWYFRPQTKSRSTNYHIYNNNNNVNDFFHLNKNVS